MQEQYRELLYEYFLSKILIGCWKRELAADYFRGCISPVHHIYYRFSWDFIIEISFVYLFKIWWEPEYLFKVSSLAKVDTAIDNRDAIMLKHLYSLERTKILNLSPLPPIF